MRSRAPPHGSYRKIPEGQTRTQLSASTWQLQENTGSSDTHTVESLHVAVTKKYWKFKHAHSRAPPRGSYRKIPEVQIRAQYCRLSQDMDTGNSQTRARGSYRKIPEIQIRAQYCIIGISQTRALMKVEVIGNSGPHTRAQKCRPAYGDKWTLQLVISSIQ